MIGELVASFRITHKVSVGGMGAIYRAEHELIGKVAAVKVLHPELSGNRDIVNRFFNEAKATTQIKHPGIVEVFDFGYMASGHAYLIMEFLDGMSLARRLKTGGKMQEGEAALLLRAVCSALAAAHAKGIVHRDLKPDNIFLVPDPETALGVRPKLLDFGIAKLTDIGLAGSATKTGAVMGTPTYMSPEQCRGTGDVDHRADLYSIGCILHELVCGRPPFVDRGAGELIGAHLYLEPLPPSKYLETISPEVEKLILSLLEKHPDKRPQTARDLAVRLAQVADTFGWTPTTNPSGVILADHAGRMTPPIEDAMMTTPESGGTVEIEISRPPTAATVSDKPTTLSGAASQSVVSRVDEPAAPRSRGLVWAATASAAAAAVVIGLVTMASLGGGAAATSGVRVVPASAPPAAPVVAAPAEAVVTEKPVAAPQREPLDHPAPLAPTAPVPTAPVPAVAAHRPARPPPTAIAHAKPAPHVVATPGKPAPAGSAASSGSASPHVLIETDL